MDRDGEERLDWRAALEAIRDAYAEGSIRVHREQLEKYEQWCLARELPLFPAEPHTIAEHVSEMFPDYAVATVNLRLSAIRRMHQLFDLPDPTRAFPVRLAWRRGIRAHGRRPRQARAINAPLLQRMLATCPDTLVGLRDRVLISVGYDTLCRCGEVVSLRIEDLTELPDGSARILVRRSKSDPFGEGQWAFLSAGTLAIVKTWLARTGLTSGPVLRKVHKIRPGTGVGRATYNKAVRRAALRAGERPEDVFTSHSLRVGAAQDLAMAGRSLVEIMRAGRWRHLDAVALYVRGAEVNVRAGSDGDTYPMIQRSQIWRGVHRGGRKPHRWR